MERYLRINTAVSGFSTTGDKNGVQFAGPRDEKGNPQKEK